MVNIFYGQNAQGKTNLLEAMFYAAFGMSHRTAQEDDMQRLDTNQLAVGINFEDLHGVNDVKIKDSSSMVRIKRIVFERCKGSAQGTLRNFKYGDVFT